VINTHSHFDHAGGLRAFVAEGATVVTQQINKPYYEKIWSNPHTLAPDKLSKNPKKPTFKTVADHLQLTDGNHVIECPWCGHHHCRVVKDGKVTEDRWTSRNVARHDVDKRCVWKADSQPIMTSTAAHYIRSLWLNRLEEAHQ